MSKATSATAAGVLTRWERATQASVDALAHADPSRSYRWAAAPLRSCTLATTRLARVKHYAR